MSGTSVDSVDAVLCEVGEKENGRLGARVLGFYEHPMPSDLRQRIFQSFEDGPGGTSLGCTLNFEIGAAFADAAAELMLRTFNPREKISAIASHGQTLYHVPPHMARPAEGLFASTFQVGEASVMAARTGLRVISDFRVADMAVGGNGAPLVPFADYHLFSQPDRGIVVQNIGGIANCTWLPAGGRLEDVIAFDTGPGNMMIDAFTHHFFPGKTYDKDGEIAARGSLIEPLLQRWLALPYIQAPPPKTTGRELFGVAFVRQAVADHPHAKPEDLVSTATHFAAASITENLRLHIQPNGQVDHLYLAGGGALNPFLVKLIRKRAADLGFTLSALDETGISSKARECVAFALLGYARLHNIPANVPSATGAACPALLGKISDPPVALSFPVENVTSSAANAET